MKKQYVMAMLLLIGFGVMSTMAFTLDTTTISTPETLVSGEQIAGEIATMRILPGRLDGSIVYFIVTLDDNAAKSWTLQLLDSSGDLLDVSAYNTAFDIMYKEPAGTFAAPATQADSLGEGYSDFTTLATTGTTVWIKLVGDETAGAADGLYHNIGAVIISAVDTA